MFAIASAWGVFTPLDGRLYDFFVRNSPNVSSPNRQVVLIDTPVAAFFNAGVKWDEIADTLLLLNAKQVVFTLVPEGDAGLNQRLLAKPGVVLAAESRVDPENGAGLQFNLPVGEPALAPHAASVISQPLLGIHRYQEYALQIGGRKVPTVEAAVARRLAIKVPETGRFLVNFGGAAAGLPRMRLQQVLQGTLIKEIVSGRVVMIGIGKERFQRTVVTPVTRGNLEITKLDYHGFALDSLLNRTAVASLHPLAQGSFLIAVWLGFFLIIQAMTFRKAMIVATLAVLALCVFSALILGMLNLHVPVLGSVVVIGTTLVAVFQSKTQSQNWALSRLVTEIGLAGTGQPSGQRVPGDTAFWSHVLAMVDQLLPVTQVVLLERPKHAKHLRKVSSLRCASDVIEEKRRDFGRQPYADAIEKNLALEVNDYLNAPLPNERQFLAPLLWDGQVLGFWAFGIPADQLALHPSMMEAVAALSRRLSELLFERRQAANAHALASGWHDTLVDQRDLAMKTLTHHLHLIGQHVSILEDIFNGLDAPTIVYDLFGRPLITNTSMKTLLKVAEIDADGKSAADMLQLACDLLPGQARVALVEAIFDVRKFKQPARFGDERYQLHASTLRDSSAPITTSKDALQNIHGLLIQLFPAGQEATMAMAPDAAQHDEGQADLCDTLQQAITQIAASPEHDMLRFAVDGIDAPAIVSGNSNDLRDILEALLTLLAQDSRQQGTIVIALKRREAQLSLTISNQGFGMPDSKLQTILDGPARPESDVLQRIRQLRTSAFGASGTLALSSTVGHGYTVHAAMRLAA